MKIPIDILVIQMSLTVSIKESLSKSVTHFATCERDYFLFSKLSYFRRSPNKTIKTDFAVIQLP